MARSLVRIVLGSVLISAVPAAFAAEQGMTLHTVSPFAQNNKYGDGPMVLRYLSNNEADTLVKSATVYGPCFSPDGKKVAYAYNRQRLMVTDIDGDNKVPLCSLCTTYGSKEPYLSWCNDGYIYWSQCDRYIRRIKADGSVKKLDTVYTSNRSCQPTGGGVVDECWDIHNLQLDNGAKRGIWTKPPNNKFGQWGWSNSVLELDKAPLSEVDWSSGCQSSISPSGTLATRSNGEHSYFYIMKFGPTSDADWNDCTNSSCANFVFYGPDPVPGLLHHIIRWSRNDSDIICFTHEPTDADHMDARTMAGSIYHLSTKTAYKVGSGFVWDYYGQEIRTTKVAPEATAGLRQDTRAARFLQASDGSLRVRAGVSGIVTVTDLRGRLVARRHVTPASTATVGGAPGYRAVTFASGSGSSSTAQRGATVVGR